MATTAVSAHGSLIKIGDAGSPESFTTLFEVKSFSGPTSTLNAIDASHQSSTNHVKEYIGGMLDRGEVSGECNWKADNATQSATAGIVYIQTQRTVRNSQIVTTHTAPATLLLPMLVTSVGFAFDMESALTLAWTFKVSSDWTWS